jgi:ankyrin repeat protein
MSSKGIFIDTYKGDLTKIVKRFNSIVSADDPSNKSGLVQSNNDILKLLIERDEKGRTAFDIACYLGFKNIALYLMTKMGTA